MSEPGTATPGPRWVRAVTGAPRADLALCAGALVIAALYWAVAADQPSTTTWCEAAITTVLAVLLAIRRTALLPAFAATYLLLGAMAALALATPTTISASPLLVCAPLSLVAVTDLARSRLWGVAALVVGVAGATVSPVVQDAETRLWLYSAHVLVLVAAYLWAARRRAARLERTREITARVALARAQERELISVELHDVLGHSLTVIHAQANAALSATDHARPDLALVAIRTVAKSSLREIRSLMALLRGEQDQAPLDLAADLHRVIAQARAAGLDVQAHLPADDVLARWQGELEPSTRLALARCVQEAMTNALRHAGPDQAAHVEVIAGRASIEVTITNTTDHAAGATAGGYGLIGLRERVRLLGGTLACGPSPTGFTLAAHLPLTPSEIAQR